MKYLHALLCALTIFGANTLAVQHPRLVVVICIDQFPYEYLTRFNPYFGVGGFRRLRSQGAEYTNALYEHGSDVTAVGHAVITSGSYARHNGIVGNNWFDRARNATVYCVDDTSVSILGGGSGGRSPANFIGSTLGDKLREATGFRSKVISLSTKDRSAILLGGRSANAAYWMVDTNFVTSTYYMKDLPSWVNQFNRAGNVGRDFGKVWEHYLPDSAYRLMDRDDAPYEVEFAGLGRTFPHPVNGGYPARRTHAFLTAWTATPFPNELLLLFAQAAIREEKLGKRGVIDLLCISFSANDLVGHAFGPHSHEVLDITVRTDRLLASLFSFLDSEFGSRNYLLALTSDHGIAPIPEYLQAHDSSVHAGRISPALIRETCESALADKIQSSPGWLSWLESILSKISNRFGAVQDHSSWIHSIIGTDVYLNRDLLITRNIPPDAAARMVANALLARPEIAAAYTKEDMSSLSSTATLERRTKNGYFEGRSGDIVFVLKPFFIEGDEHAGTTHGAPYEYNAHVPLMMIGPGIRRGRYTGSASPADLAPTLAVLLGIKVPSWSDGRILSDALK